MPEATTPPQTSAPAVSQVDWDDLKESLGTSTVAETQQRAYEIAKFVAEVENDKDSELILKTGDKKLALKLNKPSA
jgi:hypothetical protein